MKSIPLKALVSAGVLLYTAQPAAAAYGEYCREYSREAMIGGRHQEIYGTACQQPDGSWKIVEDEDKEQEVAYYAPRPIHVNHVSYVTTREYIRPPVFSFSFGNVWKRPHHHSFHGRDWDNHRRYDRHYNHDRRGRGGDRRR